MSNKYCHWCKGEVSLIVLADLDGIEVNQFSMIRARGEVTLYWLHTECMLKMTEDSSYIPNSMSESCKICNEIIPPRMASDRSPLAIPYISFYRCVAATAYSMCYILFHEDCFESVAGDIMPIQHSEAQVEHLNEISTDEFGPYAGDLARIAASTWGQKVLPDKIDPDAEPGWVIWP